MGACGRNPEEHCCWLGQAGECPYVKTTSQGKRRKEGFFWQCSLRTELGDWEKVHEDPRYLEVVRPVWDRLGVPDCGGWPQNSSVGCDLCGDE